MIKLVDLLNEITIPELNDKEQQIVDDILSLEEAIVIVRCYEECRDALDPDEKGEGEDEIGGKERSEESAQQKKGGAVTRHSDQPQHEVHAE